MKKRVVLVGLDSASPELVFGRFLNELPNIKKMAEKGIYGRLESCIPPITIPAWACMVTSKTPGELGLYGFRHRKDDSYTEFRIPTFDSIKTKALWNILGEHGKKSCLVSVPPTYPPREINGIVISCFLTPSAENEYTYPKDLKKEIEALVGEYIFDAEFRTEEREGVLKEIYEMTEKRFEVIKYLLKNKELDFLMSVEIGLDRMHHAFWKFFDEEHHMHTAGSKYKDAIKDYYKYIDRKIGEILELLDENTSIIIASDHGAKRMKGCICINEWLIKEGYLVLKEKPHSIIDLEKANVDWGKTKAWGWGGYYARIFLNIKGREKDGIIEKNDYERVRNEIKEKLMNLRDEKGTKMNNLVCTPEELYGRCEGDKPDLMAIFGELYYRSAGTVGHNKIYLSENDKGPDDAMHSMHGIFLFYDPKTGYGKKIGDISIYDIAPTVLKLLGINGEIRMRGKAVSEIKYAQ